MFRETTWPSGLTPEIDGGMAAPADQLEGDGGALTVAFGRVGDRATKGMDACGAVKGAAGASCGSAWGVGEDS